MARQAGLGRGLDALLPSGDPTPAPGAPTPAPSPPPTSVPTPPATPSASPPTTPPTSQSASPPAATRPELGEWVHQIALGEIHPNPQQPRSVFDPEALAQLTDSVASLGVLQPILVRERPGRSGYELIAGERRCRAAREAGLATVPAIVRTIDDTRSLQEALVENVQRENLNPLEEATAYQHMIDHAGFTQEQVANAVGRSRAAVANTLRLLHLPGGVQRLVAGGDLTAGHARALLGIADPELLQDMAAQAVSEGWSVRATEEAVRRVVSPPEPEPSPEPPPEPGRVPPPAVLEVEEQLGEHLATRVAVRLGARGGKVVISFADLDDLDRLFTLMVPRSGGSTGG